MPRSKEHSNQSEFGDSIDSFMLRVAEETSPPGLLSTFLQPGSILADRFRVDSFFRRGGMGAIYRGVDLETGKTVAIKTAGQPARSLSARFAREVSILSELSHPAIVRYLAHGTTGQGALYLVMEWLDGEDLAERLRREPISPGDSLLLLRKACRALAMAHARGIVHRDIKPANLFLPNSDPKSLKVLDFGIARLSEGAPALTSAGVRLGTVGYMSPEQAMGELEVDARADVFSLGCVFYECVTGIAPFASEHPVGVLAKVLQQEPPSPSELKPELDPAIDEVVTRLLAKDRTQRPEDAGAILREFDDILSRHGPALKRRRRSLSPRRHDQKVVSVILGRKRPGASGPTGSIDDALDAICRKFDAHCLPLRTGALLLVLAGPGEANDRASQAVLCALELSGQRTDLTLAVATGLADTSTGVPVGIAIDRAAALLATNLPQPGVLLDNVTLGLVGLRFEVQQANGANILVAARRGFDVTRPLMGRSTPHVGRDREMRMLDEALSECVADGVSRAVVVTGPPGIGKTRLTGEWLARGGHGGLVRTLFAAADPTSAGSPWSLVKWLIRDAADLREADQPEVQFARLEQYLRKVLPETTNPQVVEFLAEAVGLPAVHAPSPMLVAARGNPEVMREQVRRAFHEWLRAEMDNLPLLLVLEDLHWGDMPSIALFTEALRQNPERPLMLLALARPQIDEKAPELCERAILHLRLQGLGKRAARELIDFALESKLDTDTSARLIRLTDGNPFYLEELIRRVASGSSDWPDTVLAMVQSRIDRLDPNTRCVLLAASVFGERCWDAGLSEMVDTNVHTPLEELVREEILLLMNESKYSETREYRFRHALFRDAAYAMMTDEERRSSHGIAGDWLESRHAPDARLLADHYEAARAHERARPWLMQAAQRAINAGDLLETIELANRGVLLKAQSTERGKFLMLRAYAEALRGEPDLELAGEALELLTVGTPPWWLALGVLVFGASILGKPEAATPYVLLAADAPFMRDGELALGQGLVTLVGALVLLGKGSVAEAVLERARRSRLNAPEDPLFNAFLATAQCAYEAVAPVGGRWRLERALLEGRRCAKLLESLGALHGQSIMLYYLSVAAMHLGCYEEARDACLMSCRITTQIRSRDAWPFLFLGKAYLRLNQPAEALKAVEPIHTSSDRAARQMLPIVAGEAELKLGNLPAAVAAVTPAFLGKSPRLRRLAACVLARAQLQRDEVEEALNTVDAALALPTAAGLESDVELLNLKTECLLARGQHKEAREVAVLAGRSVLELARDIDDEELRQSFLENVEPCAQALTAYHQLS